MVKIYDKSEKSPKLDDLIVVKNKFKLWKNRNSNIELLRFISALSVVFWHIGTTDVNPNNWLFVNFSFFTLLPVTTFALLTGYLLSNSTKNRFLKFLPTFIFYYIINIIIGYPIIYFNNLENKMELKYLFTFGGQHWWYLWAIMPVYLIAPGINFLIKNSNKWVSFAAIWVIIILLLGNTTIQYDKIFSLENIGYLGMIYGLGAWWGLYENIFEKYKKSLLTICLLYLLIFQIVVNVNFYVFGTFLYYRKYFILFIILGSLFLIMIFKQIKMKKRLIINYLGVISLPIYLFHYLIKDLVEARIMNHVYIPGADLQLLVFFLLISSFTILLSVFITFIEFYYVNLINSLSYEVKNYYHKLKKSQKSNEIKSVCF